jgi:hypothetical protein
MTMTSTPATRPTTVCCTAVALLVVLFGVVAAINAVLAITSAVWWPLLVATACTTAMLAVLATVRAHGHSVQLEGPPGGHRGPRALFGSPASNRRRSGSQTTVIPIDGLVVTRARSRT